MHRKRNLNKNIKIKRKKKKKERLPSMVQSKDNIVINHSSKWEVKLINIYFMRYPTTSREVYNLGMGKGTSVL